MKHLRTLLSLLVGLMLFQPTQAAQPNVEKLARSVTIYRDSFGVPHVYGPTDASCVFGFAYAQAEDNFHQIEETSLRAIGRSAEIDGEVSLPLDLFIRQLEISALARAEYEQADARFRQLLDAYAQGVNYFLARHPHIKPRHLTRFEPWYPLAVNRFGWLVFELPDFLGLTNDDRRNAAPPQELRGPKGSNAWAISAKRSASGHALLFANPHGGFFGTELPYEAHLHSDEGWNFSGAGWLGEAFPYLGHNETLGWSFTSNYSDYYDLYAESFDDPRNPLAYRYGKGHRLATEWSETIKVKTERGLEERRFTLRKTHHGPIVAVRDGKPLA